MHSRLFRHFWIIPASTLVLFLTVAHLCLYLDQVRNFSASMMLWHVQSLTGAHDLVYAVAASMYTFVASTFTISIAALSFASRDMGPRLLEDFTQDWRSQLTLGVLLGTFGFNLWTIAAIQSTPATDPVPLLTVNVAVLLAYLSAGFLIMFIYLMTQAMNITALVNRLGRTLHETIMDVSDTLPPMTCPDPSIENPTYIYATGAGNLHEIRVEALVKHLQRNDAVLKLRIRPGQYAFPGMVIAECSKPLDLKPFVRFSDFRKTEHDPEFAVRQINEIAVRSMESGLKDPFTVITCMDRMGSGLCLLRKRYLRSGVHLDAQGNVRLIQPMVTFGGLIDEMFHLIRQFGSKSPAITIRMLEVLAVVMEVLDEPEYQEHVLRHARMVWEAGKANLSSPEDEQDLKRRYQAVLRHYRGQGSAPTTQATGQKA
ncbi:DUF2254 domain-containing protein [Deinococcus cellulosilyticus]|uniref:DUF2254 domain-containing protein n=1 Tax=Deinococcus cellulosilyticus (strain DSM 18568 / NBRC 106333 / KACC 11606 / 5516J-15) TaxID=1223518 RepID=A0A511MZN5_DEIC1|nr:DUF2254 domain-containing protein [Deinococcus cellulosilyticus]GEM46043.1 hypothetical protein DC3_16780 [Deinococcus cellulosilyticus NBRC 106333 = KACC 11606]